MEEHVIWKLHWWLIFSCGDCDNHHLVPTEASLMRFQNALICTCSEKFSVIGFNSMFIKKKNISFFPSTYDLCNYIFLAHEQGQLRILSCGVGLKLNQKVVGSSQGNLQQSRSQMRERNMVFTRMATGHFCFS